MARISAKALRYGLNGDLNILISDYEKLPMTKKVAHGTCSIFMQGKGGNKKKDMFVKKKIYNHYASISEHPVSFEMYWGIEKEFYEVI